MPLAQLSAGSQSYGSLCVEAILPITSGAISNMMYERGTLLPRERLPVGLPVPWNQLAPLRN